jgi:hypothetical protein
MLSTIAEIIRDLLIFVGAMTTLLIVLIIVVSKMPNTSALKGVLTALCYRLGATLVRNPVGAHTSPYQGSTCSMTLEFPLS